MGKFGWSLPPGVTQRMIDEAYGLEGLCEMCGRHVDCCECPECPVCSEYGNPECYSKHGLIVTKEQIDGIIEMQEDVELAIRNENDYWESVAKADSIFDPACYFCERTDDFEKTPFTYHGLDEVACPKCKHLISELKGVK